MSKNSQLFIAYTLLFTSAAAIVGHDAHVRSRKTPVAGLSEAERKAVDRRAKGGDTARIVSVPTVPAAQEDFIREEKRPASSESQLPRGVFLMAETLKLQSTDGDTRELSAGTQVLLVRRDKGKMKITHDGADFLVDENQITRNVRAIEKLIAARKG